MILVNDLHFESGAFSEYWYVFADVLYLDHGCGFVRTELSIEEWLYHSGVK